MNHTATSDTLNDFIQQSLCIQHKEADRLMSTVAVLATALLLGIGYSYSDTTTSVTWGLISLLPVALGQFCRGTLLSRCLITLSLVMLIASHIQVSKGLLEFHFGFFVLLGFLAYYKDYRIIVFGAAVIAVHHVLFSYLQYAGFECYVYRGPFNIINTTALHALYVVIESAVLIVMSLKDEESNKISLRSQMILQRLQGSNGQIDLQQAEPVEFLGKPFALAQVFNQYRDKMRAVLHTFHTTQASMGRLNQHTLALSTSSQKISDAALSGQKEVKELLDTMRTLDNHSQQFKDFVNKLLEHMQDSGLAVEQAFSVFAGIQKDIQQSASDIQDLGQSAKRVDEIVQSMRSVANETRLLSLNAAIEAARCGEQGRGFAVVADKVRNLSEQSAKDVLKVKEITSTINRTVSKALDQCEGMRANSKNSENAHLALSRQIQELKLHAAEQSMLTEIMFNLLQESMQRCQRVASQLDGTEAHARSAHGVTENAKSSLNDTQSVLETLNLELKSFRLSAEPAKF